MKFDVSVTRALRIITIRQQRLTHIPNLRPELRLSASIADFYLTFNDPEPQNI